MMSSSDLEESHALKTLKCWQSERFGFVWQIALPRNLAETVATGGKAHLCLDWGHKIPGAVICAKKPDVVSSVGAASEIARKYLRGAPITNVWRDQSNSDVWVEFCDREGRSWFMHCTSAHNGEMSIIDNTVTSILQIGSRGIFTKRKPVTNVLPQAGDGNFVSIIGNLLQGLRRDDVEGGAAAEADDGSTSDQLKGGDEEKAKASSETGDFSEIHAAWRDVRRKLSRRKKLLVASLSKLEKGLPTKEQIAMKGNHAILLQQFSYLIKPELLELSIGPEIYGGKETVVLSINPELSPGANVEAAFQDLKKCKKSRAIGDVQGKKLLDAIQALDRDLGQLQDTGQLAEVPELVLERHGINAAGGRPSSAGAGIRQNSASLKQSSGKSAAMEFRLDGVRYLVGRSAEDNDELTKSAKSNDYWVHVAGIPGSHVIVPRTGASEVLSMSMVRTAAILALHYSKLRGDRAGEVYVAKRHDLKKRRGMAAGTWQIMRSETVFVRYEEQELKAVLGALVRNVSI